MKYQFKNKNALKCSFSNKIVGNKPVVLTKYAREYLLCEGYHVPNYNNIWSEKERIAMKKEYLDKIKYLEDDEEEKNEETQIIICSNCGSVIN